MAQVQSSDIIEALRHEFVKCLQTRFKQDKISIKALLDELPSGKKGVSIYFYEMCSKPCFTFEFNGIEEFKMALFNFLHNRNKSIDLIVKSKADFFLDKKNHDRVAEYYLHDVTLNDRNQCLQLARKEAVSCLERLDRVYTILNQYHFKTKS